MRLPAYLDDTEDRARGVIDIVLDVWLSTAHMRAQGATPVRVVRSSLSGLHWTPGN